MSQPEIPDNNLPVYLQQYEVNILNTDKLRPCNDQSCVSSERGCCPDNVTPVPPSGECEIGGCAGTEFGCCPFSTEAKADAQGSNCGTIAGSVLYTTVGAVPSNVPEARVWQLDLSGSLKPGVEKYYIVYDFQNVNYKYKDRITFENAITGTFTICGRVLDASKYLDYTYCDETLLLTIIIETKKWDFRLKKESAISYQIQMDDFTCLCQQQYDYPTGTLKRGYDTTSKKTDYFGDGLGIKFSEFSPNFTFVIQTDDGGKLYVTINLSSTQKKATVTEYQLPSSDFGTNYYYFVPGGGSPSVEVTGNQTSNTQSIVLFVNDYAGSTTYAFCFCLRIDTSQQKVWLENFCSNT